MINEQVYYSFFQRLEDLGGFIFLVMIWCRMIVFPFQNFFFWVELTQDLFVEKKVISRGTARDLEASNRAIGENLRLSRMSNLRGDAKDEVLE